MLILNFSRRLVVFYSMHYRDVPSATTTLQTYIVCVAFNLIIANCRWLTIINNIILYDMFKKQLFFYSL